MTNVKCTVVPDSDDIIFFYNMQFSFKKHLFFSANLRKMNLFELFSFISIRREVEMVWKMEITGEMERVETEIDEGR